MKVFIKQATDRVKDGFSLQHPDADSIYGGPLTTNEEAIITVPNETSLDGCVPGKRNQYVAIMKCTPGTTVFYALNKTVTVPVAVGLIDGPIVKSGQGITFYQDEELHFITPDEDVYISLEFYQKS